MLRTVAQTEQEGQRPLTEQQPCEQHQQQRLQQLHHLIEMQHLQQMQQLQRLQHLRQMQQQQQQTLEQEVQHQVVQQQHHQHHQHQTEAQKQLAELELFAPSADEQSLRARLRQLHETVQQQFGSSEEFPEQMPVLAQLLVFQDLLRRQQEEQQLLQEQVQEQLQLLQHLSHKQQIKQDRQYLQQLLQFGALCPFEVEPSHSQPQQPPVVTCDEPREQQLVQQVQAQGSLQHDAIGDQPDLGALQPERQQASEHGEPERNAHPETPHQKVHLIPESPKQLARARPSRASSPPRQTRLSSPLGRAGPVLRPGSERSSIGRSVARSPAAAHKSRASPTTPSVAPLNSAKRASRRPTMAAAREIASHVRERPAQLPPADEDPLGGSIKSVAKSKARSGSALVMRPRSSDAPRRSIVEAHGQARSVSPKERLRNWRVQQSPTTEPVACPAACPPDQQQHLQHQQATIFNTSNVSASCDGLLASTTSSREVDLDVGAKSRSLSSSSVNLPPLKLQTLLPGHGQKQLTQGVSPSETTSTAATSSLATFSDAGATSSSAAASPAAAPVPFATSVAAGGTPAVGSSTATSSGAPCLAPPTSLVTAVAGAPASPPPPVASLNHGRGLQMEPEPPGPPMSPRTQARRAWRFSQHQMQQSPPRPSEQQRARNLGASMRGMSHEGGHDGWSQSSSSSGSGSLGNEVCHVQSGQTLLGLQCARQDRRKSMSTAMFGANLLREALAMVVPAQEAMHPQRAAGGYHLLEHLADAAIHTTRRLIDDGEDVVRKLFLDSLPASGIEIESIEQVFQPGLLARFLRRVAEDRTSVEATFHGTRAEHIGQIMREGLNPNMCVTGAYGRGAYVGTHAGVAHQYADPDESGQRHIAVILAVVGPNAVKGSQGEQALTTAMDRLVNPTQYCFVDEDRLYVSHLVRYRTTNSERHRVGGGWEDPFQVCLDGAVRRAAIRRQRGGTR